MRSRATAESVIDALLMAIWRRRLTKKVLVHSDQGAQYTSKDWQTFLKDNNLEASISRGGNCYDDVTELKARARGLLRRSYGRAISEMHYKRLVFFPASHKVTYQKKISNLPE